eukprot:scaffold858_cov123-Cylindrotheca_fusiformis.AAC.4
MPRNKRGPRWAGTASTLRNTADRKAPTVYNLGLEDPSFSSDGGSVDDKAASEPKTSLLPPSTGGVKWHPSTVNVSNSKSRSQSQPLAESIE